MPGQDVPVVGANGLMTPVWFSFFNDLMRRGVLDMPDVDNSTAITNGQVLVFNGTTGKLKPGAN